MWSHQPCGFSGRDLSRVPHLLHGPLVVQELPWTSEPTPPPPQVQDPLRPLRRSTAPRHGPRERAGGRTPRSHDPFWGCAIDLAEPTWLVVPMWIGSLEQTRPVSAWDISRTPFSRHERRNETQTTTGLDSSGFGSSAFQPTKPIPKAFGTSRTGKRARNQ